MKKLIKLAVIICLFITKTAFAQNYTPFLTNPANNSNGYIYVGSLSPSDAGNAQKLKVSVIGGPWEAFSTGETTYYIANRNQLVINQVTTGGDNYGRYTLKGYTNSGGSLVFYLLTNNFSSIAVRSFEMTAGNSVITNTFSATLPAGLTEITPLTINKIQTTDMNGNIGIGTDNTAGYKLAVNGSAIATSMTVKLQANWPDYVFKPTYKLPELSEVRAYIDANQHLPEIPSEAEIKKSGINLGEVNAQLLKKIEELTLYLIEKDKEIKELQSAVTELKNAKK